jgi:hypothetical protein
MKIKTFFGLSFLLFGFISCQNSRDIFKDFTCKTPLKLKNIERVLDAKENFSLDIPKYWKTELYIDDNSSMFTTADTTKQYLNTYLIKATLINSKLILNTPEIEKIKAAILSDKHQTISAVVRGTFKSYPALLISAKSDKFKSGITSLHLYTPISEKFYFEIEIHCFGAKNIDKRLCEAIHIINSLKINEL